MMDMEMMKEMSKDYFWVVSAVFGGIVVFLGFMRRFNEWYFVRPLGEKRHSLPPGDLGWPLIGTMLSFFRAFKSGNADSFLNSFVKRFGDTKAYRVVMFGKPTVIVTTPEACRMALMDDQRFGPGWPKSVEMVMGKKGLHNVTVEEHKRILRLTAAPLRGHEALAGFVEHIKGIVLHSLDEWSSIQKPIEFLNEFKMIAFKVIINVLMSGDTDPRLAAMEHEYTALNEGVISLPINFPGFACYRGIRARKKLVKIFADVVNERRAMRARNEPIARKDMMELMMDAVDEDGGQLSDEEIIDLLIIYLNAGHESSALTTMWILMLLEQHPHVYQKAKEEQEEILKRRPAGQDGVSFKEVREMSYANKVIDETLRYVNLAFVLFREAKCDIQVNGYTIPKGWKVMSWVRNIHMNPEIYPNPKEFNPSRWDDITVKAGTFLPFGAGSRLCPGRDLARLEVCIFLHYYLLNYKFERVNPACRMKYLPVTIPIDNCLATIKRITP